MELSAIVRDARRDNREVSQFTFHLQPVISVLFHKSPGHDDIKGSTPAKEDKMTTE